MTQQPNLLLVMADQLAASFLPSYGHRVVKAPALQRLADRGVQFTSMYSNSPLCAPARFAMMSGQRNSRIGAYDNAAEFAADDPDLRPPSAQRRLSDVLWPARCISSVPISCTASRSA